MMATTKKMEEVITKKEELITKLNKKVDKLTDCELKEKEERNKILNSDLSEKIEGKITDKAKTAYCDEQLKDKNNEITWLKNDISKIKREIGLYDDKISLYKYIIREKQL